MGWFKNIFVKKNVDANQKVTDHFTIKEFGCKDGTPYPADWVESKLIPLCEMLEIIRDHYKRPILINSAYRTPEHNKKIGGAKGSKHVEGIAVDFKVQGYSPREVAAWVREQISMGKMIEGGVGDYSTFTHYDIRGTMARWRGK